MFFLVFEGNPVGEVTTRRGTDTPVHHPEKPAGPRPLAAVGCHINSGSAGARGGGGGGPFSPARTPGRSLSTSSLRLRRVGCGGRVGKSRAGEEGTPAAALRKESGGLDQLRGLRRISQLSMADLGASPVFPLSKSQSLTSFDKILAETRTWLSTLIRYSPEATRCPFFPGRWCHVSV